MAQLVIKAINKLN